VQRAEADASVRKKLTLLKEATQQQQVAFPPSLCHSEQKPAQQGSVGAKPLTGKELEGFV